MTTTRSVYSLRSMRSTKTPRSDRDERKYDDGMENFDSMLVMACARFQCPYSIIVNKETKSDDYYKAMIKPIVKGKSKRMSFITQPADTSPNTASAISDNSSTLSGISSIQINSFIVTMIYDNFNNLTEIVIVNRKDIPRILLKIICTLTPFYKKITKITISKCKINMLTIYELSKILKDSTINNICLDGSAMPIGDFKMLLNTTNLTSLSLCRCKINDEACEQIATMLRDSAPADNLMLLNLTSNHITDVGAKYIAESLRTNRHLRYLNLADNYIQDVGAGFILDVLIEFPLTYDEIMGMRRRRMNYLRLKNDLHNKYLSEHCTKSFDEISRSSACKKRKSKGSIKKEKDKLNSWTNEEYLKTKAEMMTLDILGGFQDPFQPDTVKCVDKYYYSMGNGSLTYLNLAYNNLTYMSIKKLCDVIKYQNLRKLGSRGLTKVVVDGNNLPIDCIEMDTIKEILGRKVMRYSGRVSEIGRRKSRYFKE